MTADWYDGPGLDVEFVSRPEVKLHLWPLEVWGYTVGDDSDWEFIRNQHISSWTETSTGGVTFEAGGLKRDGASIHVEVQPEFDAVDLTYRLRHDWGAGAWVGLGPCLQLPDAFLGGPPRWERAKQVFVAIEGEGLSWIADTAQTRGSNQRAPWSQVFFAASHPHTPVKHGFGLNPQRVSPVLTGAVSDDGRHLLAVVADPGEASAYAFLNCLHANIGSQNDAPWTARYRIYIHDNDLGGLLKRVRSDFPGLPVPDPGAGFIPPTAQTVVLQSFERAATTWTHEGEATAVIVTPDASFPATDGERCLKADLQPGSTLNLPPIAVTGDGQQRWLSVDVADLDSVAKQAPGSELILSVSGLGSTREFSTEQRVLLSRGSCRRVVFPLTGDVPSPVQLSVVVPRDAGPRRIQLDTVALHTGL